MSYHVVLLFTAGNFTIVRLHSRSSTPVLVSDLFAFSEAGGGEDGNKGGELQDVDGEKA